MAHARSTIRRAVENILGSGLTLVHPSQVYASNIYTLQENIDTAVNIKIDGDELLEREFGTMEIRALQLGITVYHQAVEDVDDELDEIVEEVESSLGEDPKLGVGLLDSHFLNYASEFTDELDQPLGTANISWRCVYQVDSTDPSTIIE